MPFPLLVGAAAYGIKALAKSKAGRSIGSKIGGTIGRKIFGAKKMKKVAAVGAAVGAGYELAKGKKSTALTPPIFPGSQLPQLGSGGVQGMTNRVGFIPGWRGPGGKFQMPWSDPNIPQFIQQFALDDAYLKPMYRAPKGYVVIRDPNGRPYAVLKQAARSFGLWRPAKKPPISVGDWNKFQTAKAVEKKLRKIAGPALRKHTIHTSKCVKKGR